MLRKKNKRKQNVKVINVMEKIAINDTLANVGSTMNTVVQIW